MLTAVPAISECLWRVQAESNKARMRYRSPRDFRVLVAVPSWRPRRHHRRHRSPRDFRVLVAVPPTTPRPHLRLTAVPAISECLWRRLEHLPPQHPTRPQSPRFQSACGGNHALASSPFSGHRSPRDFRVLVADAGAEDASGLDSPQSPRFQSACGGEGEETQIFVTHDRSPRDFRVLVAVPASHAFIVARATAVPAISECLWRDLWRVAARS